MRRVQRLSLDNTVQEDLDARQAALDRRAGAGALDVAAEWKSARSTKTMGAVVGTLHRMMGGRQRCMYCLDSHGTDIDHFWPKKPFPERMFVWPNLLLSCTECGRLKGDTFPLSKGRPLLVDPTAEDPWLHLDFDPTTGNLVARFDLARNDFSAKGSKTVQVLGLDRREAMATGYQRTFRRLARLVEEALRERDISADCLIGSLREADDHGLLNWCLRGNGQKESPFRELRAKLPAVWNACAHALES